MIKTFRGLLTDGQQERIRLETIDGKTGYRIIKLQIMGSEPGAQNYESVVKVFSVKQTLITATVDFSEQTLLAAATYQGNQAAFNYPTTQWTVFDRVTFNQDIFVTHQDLQNNKMNYYMELEQISLDDVEATAVILKNFRNTNTVA
jgi:hypothetical protein